jgi:hypothetical protein
MMPRIGVMRAHPAAGDIWGATTAGARPANTWRSIAERDDQWIAPGEVPACRGRERFRTKLMCCHRPALVLQICGCVIAISSAVGVSGVLGAVCIVAIFSPSFPLFLFLNE